VACLGPFSWRRSICGRPRHGTNAGAYRSDHGAQGFEPAATDHLGFSRQAHALGIREAFGFAAELFEQDFVLGLQVFDNGLLLSIDPTGTMRKKNWSCAFMVSRKPSKPQALKLQLPFG